MATELSHVSYPCIPHIMIGSIVYRLVQATQVTKQLKEAISATVYLLAPRGSIPRKMPCKPINCSDEALYKFKPNPDISGIGVGGLTNMPNPGTHTQRSWSDSLSPVGQRFCFCCFAMLPRRRNNQRTATQHIQICWTAGCGKGRGEC